MNYQKTPEFKKDFKKLLKKFSSLKDDLKINKKFRIELFHLQKIDSRGIFEIKGAGNSEKVRFFKIKKFQCKSLKGRGANSGLRVVYAFEEESTTVTFLEIYFKAKKPNEDRSRIERFSN